MSETVLNKKKASGAENRKRKAEKHEAEVELLKKVPKLSTFFGNVTTPISNISTEIIPCSSCDSVSPRSARSDLKQSEADNAGDTSITVAEHRRIINSSDKSDWPDNPTADEKREIIKIGPCQPNGPFPVEKEGRNRNRSFDQRFYVKKNEKTSLTFRRHWLCYSPKLNVAYCLPCWLFDKAQDHQCLVNGTADWAHLGHNIDRHENSTQHAISCGTYDLWKAEKTIECLQRGQSRDASNYWRLVLRRIFDVILTLATNDLPFRAHRTEDNSTTTKSNFLEFINLLSRYDPILEELLKRPKGTVNYLSSQIQNEVLDILAKKINTQIKQEIEDAAFVSVITDSTQDLSKVDQLSTVFRYVSYKKNENGNIVGIDIKESFVGFTEVKSQTSAALEDTLLKVIENFTDCTKLRGQGYDGAANMSGLYNGLQARLSRKNPYARYIHCCAHNLNLVINDTVRDIPAVRNFFDNLETLYAFFSAITRWSMLMEGPMKQTLKKVCPTRWSSRIQAIDSLRCRYFDVMKILTYLSLQGKNNAEKTQANGLMKYFGEFSTVVLIVLQSKILGAVDIVSKSLQAKQEDIGKAAAMLSSLVAEFSEMRRNWHIVKNEAKKMSEEWKIDPKFSDKRIRYTRKMFGELHSDERLQDAEKRFETEVFNCNLDIVTTQLRIRFKALKEISKTFSCLSPRNLLETSDQDIITSAKALIDAYPEDISLNVGAQLVRLKTCFSNQFGKIRTIQELTQFLLINCQASSSFSDVITACFLFLTLPVSVATAERSFSKLKLIKTYLRTSMSQSRLNALATISIERQRVKELDLDPLIDEFAEIKARRSNI